MTPQSQRSLIIAAIMTAVTLAILVLLGPEHLVGARPLPAGETYVVNSTGDAPDTDVADGVCAAVSGLCTLRAAIMQANSTTGPKTITVPAGVYSITRVGYDDAGVSGDFDITNEITILGAGAEATIVDGNGPTTGDRVFHVLAGGGLRASGLTIRNGKVTGGGLSRGGGLYCLESFVGVVLDHVIVEGNQAFNGGGINIFGCPVRVTDSIIRHNAATFEDVIGNGGGLKADQVLAPTYPVLISNTSVFSNVAQFGGGVHVESARSARISESDIVSNSAASGGGIFNQTSLAGPVSTLTIVDSRVVGNQATSGGGAIESRDSLILTRTVVAGNTAGTRGGGILLEDLKAHSQFSVFESTITNNRSLDGGAIAFRLVGATDSFITVRNSTLSGNQASGNGGAIYAPTTVRLGLVNTTVDGNSAARDGGAIYVSGSSQLWLANVTLTDNRLAKRPNTLALLRGPGLFITATAAITAQNTIIAGNVRDDGVTPPVGDECFVNPTTSLRSAGFNLIQNAAGCALIGTTVGNIVGQSPDLGPLGNNGGWTRTRIPAGASPIWEAGDPNGCRDHRGLTIATDQRGASRPLGGRCDIGAVEIFHAPFAQQISPLVVPARPAFTLIITGIGLLPDTRAVWNGALLNTMQLSPNVVSVTVPSSLVTTTGVYSVGLQYGVFTPSLRSELTVTVTTVDQTIALSPLPARAFGDPPFAISASASSGLPVALSAQGACTLAGGVVTLTGAGSCTISASQAGDTIFNAAPPVQRSFAIAAGQQPGDLPPDGTYRVVIPIGRKD